MGTATTSPCPWGISPHLLPCSQDPGSPWEPPACSGRSAGPRSSPALISARSTWSPSASLMRWYSPREHCRIHCWPWMLMRGPGGDSVLGEASCAPGDPASRKPHSYSGKCLQRERTVAGHGQRAQLGSVPWGSLCSPAGDGHPREPCHRCMARRTQRHRAVTPGTPNHPLPSGFRHLPEPGPPPAPHRRQRHGRGQTTAPHLSPDSAARPSCFAKVPSRFRRLSMKTWLALGPFRRTLSMRQRALSERTVYLSCTSSTSSRLSTPRASSSSSSPEITGLLTRSTKSVRTFRSSFSVGWLHQCPEPPRNGFCHPIVRSGCSPFPITSPGCCPLPYCPHPAADPPLPWVLPLLHRPPRVLLPPSPPTPGASPAITHLPLVPHTHRKCPRGRIRKERGCRCPGTRCPRPQPVLLHHGHGHWPGQGERDPGRTPSHHRAPSPPAVLTCHRSSVPGLPEEPQSLVLQWVGNESKCYKSRSHSFTSRFRAGAALPGCGYDLSKPPRCPAAHRARSQSSCTPCSHPQISSQGAQHVPMTLGCHERL